MTTETQHNPVPKRTRRGLGLTLLETVVAIVVGLVVLGGVGALVYSATSTNKVTKAYQELTTIAQNILSFYHGLPPGSGAISTSDWIAAGIIPQSMLSSATTAVNPWGGGSLVITGKAQGYGLPLEAYPKRHASSSS